MGNVRRSIMIASAVAISPAAAALAAAVLAGASIGLGHGFQVDAGNRFLYLSDATTGPINAGGWGPLVIEGIRTDEFRPGFRKELF